MIFSGGPAQLVYNVYGFVVPLQFLQFRRGAEAEADYLGVQYMYKTGYDPASFISYFEKVKAQEKSLGSYQRFSRPIPPTADRIEKSQKTIATILPECDECVLSTSEFDTIKAKLIALDNARKPISGTDSKRPTLKRRTPSTTDRSDEPEPSDEDRPTLKRRSPQTVS